MTPRPHARTHPAPPAGGRGGPSRRSAAAPRPTAGRGRARAAALVVAATIAGTVLPASASAQIGGYVSLNGGAQATATTFTDNVVFTEFHEDADFDAAYAVGAGMIFDGGAGVRLANGIGFGVAVSRFNRLDPASIDARVPHPFFFDRPRSLTGSETDLTRMETAVHMDVRWFAPVADAVEVSIFGGPTFFNLQQDLVTAIGYDHAYPYNEASLASATTTATSASAIGFHAGADIGFYFSESVGVGALLRYSAATVDLPSDDGAIPVDAGGFQVGTGLRIRF